MPFYEALTEALKDIETCPFMDLAFKDLDFSFFFTLKQIDVLFFVFLHFIKSETTGD